MSNELKETFDKEVARAYYAGVKDSLDIVLGAGSRSAAISLLEEKPRLITDIVKEADNNG